MSLITPELRQRFDKVRAKYPQAQAAVIPLLHLMQQKEGLLSPEAQHAVADYLGMPVVKVHEVVSFYTMLSERKRGRHHLMLCNTLSCGLRGSQAVLDTLVAELGIRPGQVTPDGEFSIETVECLGACDMGAVIQVDDALHGNLDEQSTLKLIATLRARGRAS
jgi:NADH-quinone oxidoreductase E subunit